MNILLVQTLNYLLSSGGAHKANRMLMEGLAARGHRCRVIAPGGEPGSDSQERLRGELVARGIPVLASTPNVLVFEHNGVRVYAVTGDFQTYSRLIWEIANDFDPTWTLVSEDRTFLLLEAALEATPDRVVLVAHSQATLPFGPECFFADPQKTALIRQTAGIIAVSGYLRDYFMRWGGFDAELIPFPAYGPGPFPHLARFDQGYVTMINPSQIKGIAIFLALAQALPEIPFAAVPTWATTDADLAALRALPNMQIFPPNNNLDELFAQVRVLITPSLWGESFGQVVVDAMLRGVPVMASNVGGLPEAKLGVPYLLPVNPIHEYQMQFDVRSLPTPVVPPQNSGPWLAALQQLIGERSHYEQLSAESRAAALRFVGSLGAESFERYLAGLTPVAARKSNNSRAYIHSSDRSKQEVLEQVATLEPARHALLALRLQQQRQHRTQPAIPALPRGVDSPPLPLSFAQQRLWFLQQMEPDNPFYNTPALFDITGYLDVAALEQSINALISRHEVLRSNFPASDGQPVQVVAAPQPIALPMADLRHLPTAQREAQAQRLLLEQARRPFDLAHDRLIRPCLLRFDDTHSQLLLTMHHIVCDGWSMDIIVAELHALYSAFCQNQPAPLPDLPIQYADFAAWQREQLQGEKLAQHLSYWQEQFLTPVQPLNLPTDRPRPAVKAYRGATLTRPLPSELRTALEQLGHQEHATLFMTMLAAYAVLLQRLSGQNDLVVGVPIAGRTRREIERLIGCFVNTLPLRINLAGNPSFRSLLAQVRQGALNGYAHQDLPLEKLIETLALKRDLSYNPLFQVTFSINNMQIQSVHSADLLIQFREALNPDVAAFDLALSIDHQGCTIEYDADLFVAASIKQLLRQYETLLAAVVANPDQPIATLPLLSPDERKQLLSIWSQSPPPLPAEHFVHQLITEQAAHQPSALALIDGEKRISYAELEQRSNQLAHYLRQLGVGPEQTVGVCCPRSAEAVIAMLAVLKAGGAYVPLDPNAPLERLAWMIADAQPRALLYAAQPLGGPAMSLPLAISLADTALLAGQPTQPPASNVAPDNLAYVIYTSGSTGKPKGVMITQRNLAHTFQAWHTAQPLPPSSRYLQTANVAFDVFTGDWVRALCTGGCLVFCPDDALLDAASLYALMRDQQIDHIDIVPALARNLIAYLRESQQRLNWLRVLVVGSDSWFATEYAELQRYCGARTCLINAYGLTETTIDGCYAAALPPDLPAESLMPIGRPVAGTQVYVLDQQHQPLPIGVPGELYIGGPSLARGYLNRPDLTAERFIPHPWAQPNDQGSTGATPRLYKTGDRVRWRADGTLEFLGRNDYQVKLRGFRVELAEIEAVLRSHPTVSAAVVLLREELPGTPRLVAYVVPTPDATTDAADSAATSVTLRAFLKDRLPDYMIPAAFVMLTALPLTANGKLDRQALPAPEQSADHAATFVAPSTLTEETLAGIWSELLGVERIGIYDNFFDLGGHSLLATRVVARARAAFQIEIPVRAIFEAPTLAELAVLVEELLIADIAALSDEEALSLLNEVV